jgi:hypothetical protein
MESITCPKCRRSLEGDGEYVCCARAALVWRCDDCRKVSEGFAFPYGRCATCGGKLHVLDRRDVESSAALEAIRVAFEIELGGLAFYARARKEADDPILKAVFGKLEAMEQAHMTTLSRRYHAAIPRPGGELDVKCAALYAGTADQPDDPANLLRIAIAFEQRAVTFFGERITGCPEGSPERQLYQELAAEALEHVALLLTELGCMREAAS